MEVELPVLGSESGSGSQVCKRSTSNVDGCYRSNETISHATTSRRAKYLRASALQRRLCMRHSRHVRVRVRVRVRVVASAIKGGWIAQAVHAAQTPKGHSFLTGRVLGAGRLGFRKECTIK